MTNCKEYLNGTYYEKLGNPERVLCHSMFDGEADLNIDGNLIVRPSFNNDTININSNVMPIMPPEAVANIGNTILRPNFISPEIQSRTVVDFDKLKAIDIENEGIKVQLGQSTIDELFKSRAPDPRDVSWLREKARMIRGFKRDGMNANQIKIELQTNKPLGREQRTIEVKHNVAHSKLSTASKLVEIQQEIKDSRGVSRTQQATLIGQLALVMDKTDDLETLTREQLSDLGASMAQINVPTNFKRLGLIPRFVDKGFYNNNAGLINLLLFSKVGEQKTTNEYNYDLMVKNFAGREPNSIQNGMPASTLSSMVSSLGKRDKGRRFLDLERGGLISMTQLGSILSGLQPNAISSPDFAIDERFLDFG